jgi:hypothetical protein
MAQRGLQAFDDPRLVLLGGAGYFTDWVVGTNGGADFWVRVELFVAKKRPGEVEPGLAS